MLKWQLMSMNCNTDISIKCHGKSLLASTSKFYCVLDVKANSRAVTFLKRMCDIFDGFSPTPIRVIMSRILGSCTVCTGHALPALIARFMGPTWAHLGPAGRSPIMMDHGVFGKAVDSWKLQLEYSHTIHKRHSSYKNKMHWYKTIIHA